MPKINYLTESPIEKNNHPTSKLSCRNCHNENPVPDRKFRKLIESDRARLLDALALLTGVVWALSVFQFEVDAQRDLVLEATLLQPAALFRDHEPRKVPQRLSRSLNCDLNRVTETLLGSTDDLDTPENIIAHVDSP